MNTVIGSECTARAMFSAIGGWTTQFKLADGGLVGGNVSLASDPRLLWHIKTVGGIKDKRILELGPLEGGHTKMMIEAGVREVIAVEGLSDCFLRCLIVKEVFQLTKAKFLFGDFCKYVASYSGVKFDVVSATGVLYHQKNPAQLIYDLSKITDIVFVWSQVAGPVPPGDIHSVTAGGIAYYGKINNYGGTRLSLESYCGGLHDEAFWMFPDDMRKCFRDAGFKEIIENFENPSNKNGDCLLFIARK